MFKDITGLTIKGGPFQHPTSLQDILSNRMNLLYGRNGSGKSTIARSLMQARENPNGPNNYSVSFIGTGQLPLPSDKGIFVFNEDFVDNNFKLKDSLRAIVMLGRNAQLDGPIHAAEQEIKRLDGELRRLKNEAESYESSSGDKSITYWDKRVKEDLKIKYLVRLSQIGGRRINLSQALVDAVLGTNLIKPTAFQSVADLSNDIDLRLEKYLSCKTGEIINWGAPSYNLDIDAINALLSKTVQPAGLSEEDNAMLDFLSGEKYASDNYLRQTQAVVIDDNIDVCPLCHQSISNEHKDILKSRLERFRDKQTEDFKTAISACINTLRHIECDLPEFPVRDYDADINAAKECIEKANNYIGNVVQALKNKYNNPYVTTKALDKTEYDSTFNNLTASFNKLSADVKAFNDSVQENDRLLEEIKKDNIIQALWEYEADIAKYRDNVRNHRLLVGEDGTGGQYADVNTKIEIERNNLKSLRLQSEPIGEAVNIINKYLRLIFGRDRLQLDALGKDKYRILSRGSEVPPKAVSAGERNAIALAYFFACVVEQKEEGYNYSDPTLLVIDDPVSSFDIENRAGIISLLNMQCNKVLSGNDESKILILTHDLTTLKNLIAVRDYSFDNDGDNCYLLERQKVRGVKVSNIDDMTDYSQRLFNLFHFANLETVGFDNNDTSIGNTMRRLLEQYATFRYGKKWYSLFSDEKILSILPENKRDVFCDLAMRPALNPESHGTDLVLDLADLQKIAQRVLAYLYLSDRPHLEAHLKSEDKMNVIAQWANEV